MYENLLKFILPIFLMLCKKKTKQNKTLLSNKLSKKEKLNDFIKEKLYIGTCYGKRQRKYLTTSAMPAGRYSLKILVGNKPAAEKSLAKHSNRVCRFQYHSGIWKQAQHCRCCGISWTQLISLLKQSQEIKMKVCEKMTHAGSERVCWQVTQKLQSDS